ncbi:DMT family transporter [Pseudoalteromonas sp. T1lg10]|uniref:DMT family transporter n=1 Tax=Pseudoalteromonas sp. T1lg10 TaxID=2077093 RepID=UPI001F3AC19F|nr:DMT family transporter [Pseudoalteromonas sp. T1lg10]
MGLGELAAICAAIVWAFSTLLYKTFSHHLSPLQLNVSKGLLASLMMVAAIVITADSNIPQQVAAWGWLIAGGIIGIAIGDSAYFGALRNIGPARTLIIESLAPALAGILNILLLGHYLSTLAWVGIIVTTVGVVIAIRPQHALPSLDKRHYVIGVSLALLAALCQATGMVMSKGAMNLESMSSLWAAMIRLVSGTLTVALVVALIKHSDLYQAIRLKGIDKKHWLLVAVFFGTFIGLWLQLASIKYTDPAIAQTLFATAPLMVMTFGFFKREPVSANMILGGVLALAGVGILLAN